MKYCFRDKHISNHITLLNSFYSGSFACKGLDCSCIRFNLNSLYLHKLQFPNTLVAHISQSASRSLIWVLFTLNVISPAPWFLFSCFFLITHDLLHYISWVALNAVFLFRSAARIFHCTCAHHCNVFHYCVLPERVVCVCSCLWQRMLINLNRLWICAC